MKEQPEFKASEYQTANGGGLSLFTYSSCDLDYTAKLLPLVKDDIDKSRMLDYLYTQSGVKTENAAINAKALYGLAVYQEPVLLYLDELSGVETCRRWMLFIARWHICKWAGRHRHRRYMTALSCR